MRLFALLLAALFAGCGEKAPDDDGATLQRMNRLMTAIEQPGWTTPAPGVRKTKPAAPVENLLAGLEERLADNPDDANGWSLLAQSYAFVGRSDDAARAIERAVALGMNEQQLKQPVAQAQRPQRS